jgi:hypothetical protein
MGATEEEKYIAMFNAGYLMQQHEPELLEQILKSNEQKSEYIKALATGKQQRERENIILEQQNVREKQKHRKPKR